MNNTRKLCSALWNQFNPLMHHTCQTWLWTNSDEATNKQIPMDIWLKHGNERLYDKANTNQIFWHNSRMNWSNTAELQTLNVSGSNILIEIDFYAPHMDQTWGEMTKTWWQKWYYKFDATSNFWPDLSS